MNRIAKEWELIQKEHKKQMFWLDLQFGFLFIMLGLIIIIQIIGLIKEYVIV